MCGHRGSRVARRPDRSRFRRAVRPMTTAIATAAPTATASSTTRAGRSVIGGWPSSTARAGTSRWRTKTAPAGSSSTARSTTTARCGRLLEAKGHRFRTASDTERSFTPTRSTAGVRRSARGHVRVRDLRRARREVLLRGARPARQEAVLLHRLDGVLHFASETAGRSCSRRSWKGDVDLAALEGYLSLGYFIAPATIYRDVYKLQPGHWLRVATDGSRRGSTGT